MSVADVARCRNCDASCCVHGFSLYRCIVCEENDHPHKKHEGEESGCESLEFHMDHVTAAVRMLSVNEERVQCVDHVQTYIADWLQRHHNELANESSEARYGREVENVVVRRYMNDHPCPPEWWIQAWLISGSSVQLANVYKRYNIPQSEAFDWFRYDMLQQMWSALSWSSEVEQARAVRGAGLILHAHGGHSCMGFNLYILHHVLCSGVFYNFPGQEMDDFEHQATILSAYQRLSEHWNGIGDWRH